MKKILEKIGYKVNNKSGKVETKSIYVLLGFSVVYVIFSLINFGFDCFGSINANIVCGYFINIAIFARIITSEYIQMKNVENELTHENVIPSQEPIVYAAQTKIHAYFKISLITILMVFILAFLFTYSVTSNRFIDRLLWSAFWSYRGLCLSVIIVSFLQQFVIFLELKYKAHMDLYARMRIMGGI